MTVQVSQATAGSTQSLSRTEQSARRPSDPRRVSHSAPSTDESPASLARDSTRNGAILSHAPEPPTAPSTPRCTARQTVSSSQRRRSHQTAETARRRRSGGVSSPVCRRPRLALVSGLLTHYWCHDCGRRAAGGGRSELDLLRRRGSGTNAGERADERERGADVHTAAGRVSSSVTPPDRRRRGGRD